METSGTRCPKWSCWPGMYPQKKSGWRLDQKYSHWKQTHHFLPDVAGHQIIQRGYRLGTSNWYLWVLTYQRGCWRNHLGHFIRPLIRALWSIFWRALWDHCWGALHNYVGGRWNGCSPRTDGCKELQDRQRSCQSVYQAHWHKGSRIFCSTGCLWQLHQVSSLKEGTRERQRGKLKAIRSYKVDDSTQIMDKSMFLASNSTKDSLPGSATYWQQHSQHSEGHTQERDGELWLQRCYWCEHSRRSRHPHDPSCCGSCRFWRQSSSLHTRYWRSFPGFSQSTTA